MESKVYLVSGFIALQGHPNVHPYEGAARSDAILPSGWPIRSTICVVDKVDVVFCDGQDNWYACVDDEIRTAVSGQPISALY